MAEHIEEGYEKRSVSSEDEAERRAWATVNKETHGGKKSGSGQGKAERPFPLAKGWAPRQAKPPPAGPLPQRSASARKAARTRKKRAG